ncbi:MAG: hypothetical protein V1859_08130 [archaeon]
MKKFLVLVIALATVFSASASVPAFGGSGWGTCNTDGGYGAWDKISPCYTVWEPECVSEAFGTEDVECEMQCTLNTKPATFVVGEVGKTTTEITIEHLDGYAETMDGFEVRDEQGVLVCEYVDSAPAEVETWMTLVCDGLSLGGVHTLTITPKAAEPWTQYGGCPVWGQVAISSISYETENNGEIPEFTVIGALAALGIAGIYAAKKRKN